MMIENWIKPKKSRKLIHQLFQMSKFWNLQLHRPRLKGKIAYIGCHYKCDSTVEDWELQNISINTMINIGNRRNVKRTVRTRKKYQFARRISVALNKTVDAHE